MCDQYVGEIRMFAGDYAPVDWELCNGQLLQISSYELLFSLLGTTYGGDGVNTFALPDLRGRVAVGQGQGDGLSYRMLGQIGGSETVALYTSTMPAHIHPISATTNPGTSASPENNIWGKSNLKQYSLCSTAPSNNMAATALDSTGGGAEHANMMPFLTISFIIATNGYYPERQ